MRCREVILKGAAKQEWKGVDAAVSSAPSQPIGFTKQNLWCIGRMTNATLNGFFGMTKRVLCCMNNVIFFAPSLPISFAKQNLRGIGRMVNSIPNGFFGMATRVLCCMINVVFFAPSLPIGFAKQNLWGIGRMVNATLNGFTSVVKQYLRLVTTQHSLSPCAQKTVSVSQLSLHNCPFIFLVLAFCASLFPFHSLLFTFLLLYFFTFNLPFFLFYSFPFLLLGVALYFFTLLLF